MEISARGTCRGYIGRFRRAERRLHTASARIAQSLVGLNESKATAAELYDSPGQMSSSTSTIACDVSRLSAATIAAVP